MEEWMPAGTARNTTPTWLMGGAGAGAMCPRRRSSDAACGYRFRQTLNESGGSGNLARQPQAARHLRDWRKLQVIDAKPLPIQIDDRPRWSGVHQPPVVHYD